MKIYVPSYYEKFSCLAGSCRNSCCTGWEIDVDKVTLNYYRSLNTDFSREILENITKRNPHFKLKRGRCPMLDENNLCRIITELGENSLCQICADHPRFVNFFSDHTEIGLGMTCEAAAHIIVNEKKCMMLKVSGELSSADKQYAITGAEELIINERNRLLENINTHDFSTINEILEKEGICVNGSFSFEDILNVYTGLNPLNASWPEKLKKLQGKQFPVIKENRQAFKNIFWYFICRHLPDAQDEKYGPTEEEIKLRKLFASVSTFLIYAVAEDTGIMQTEVIEDISRQYSGETEYDEDNMYMLFKKMKSYIKQSC